MRAYLSIAALALLAGCGNKNTGPAETPPAGGAAAADPSTASAGAKQTASEAAPAGGVSTAPAQGLGGRTGELTNPDSNAMVFLYYDLAGLKPPIDTWVEQDSRVQYAPGPQKAPNRATVKAELEAGAAAVHGIGFIRLSMNANLSEYDPGYGEFTVRAFAPSSVVDFSALGQKVSIKFGNARVAQVWKVPQAEAQPIRDKIGGAYNNIDVDALLRITAVQPGPGGGTIVTDVVEYEMRAAQGGAIIARIKVGQ